MTPPFHLSRRQVGVRGMEADAWIGMWVPAKTPAPVVERLNRTLASVLSNAAVRKRFEDMFAEAVHMDGARINTLLVDEEKTLSALIRERNIRVD
ncbi:MAG: tripartite tricarboxylate transporter substrate-binding protein [Pseudomonadota bacterium]